MFQECSRWLVRLICTDDINTSIGESMHIVKTATEAVLVTSKDVGLDRNAEKYKDMIMSGDQNAGHYHNIKTGS